MQRITSWKLNMLWSSCQFPHVKPCNVTARFVLHGELHVGWNDERTRGGHPHRWICSEVILRTGWQI